MIGIVGGGLSGLALGAFLTELGADVRIWEAEARPGGVVRSSRVGRHVLDHGPQRTRVTPLVRRLIGWAGVEEEVVGVPPELALYVYRDGGLRSVPFRFGELLWTDLLSWRGKLRMLAEPLAARRASGSTSPETVADFFVRRFGDEAYRVLFGPLFGGLYGSDPAEMLRRHALSEALDRAGIDGSVLVHFLRSGFDRSKTLPAISFGEGMARWADALALRLGDRLVLSSPVTGLRRSSGSRGDGRGEGWRLKVGDEEVEVDTLVLTLPADAAARLLVGEASEAARRLSQLHYNHLALVHLHGDGPADALGYQVAYGETLRTRGVSWNAAALGRQGIYTAFLGGAHDPGLLRLSDREIGQTARLEFRVVTGTDTQVLSVSRTRIPAWDRSWTALEGLELPPGLHLCTNYESRVGIPGRVQRAHELARALTGAE